MTITAGPVPPPINLRVRNGGAGLEATRDAWIPRLREAAPQAKIEPGAHGGDRIVHGAPIGDDESLETPLVPEDGREQPRVLAQQGVSAQAGEQPVVFTARKEKEPARRWPTLLDAAVTTCDKMPGDSCKTPWDACCEPRESLQANTATIQIVDASGKPLKTGLRGVNGIDGVVSTAIGAALEIGRAVPAGLVPRGRWWATEVVRQCRRAPRGPCGTARGASERRL
mgnify:CR=1 FL=1